jgi:large subunit ribosomal protein L10
MRAEKTNLLDEVRAWVKSSPYLIVTDYTGMTVEQFTELRRRLAGVKAEMHVVKNTLLRKSLGAADMAAAAKIVKTFIAEFEKPKLKAGILEHAVLDAAQLRALADLPPRPVLLARLLGVLQAPATKLATLINTPATQLAQVIKAKAEKQEATA